MHSSVEGSFSLGDLPIP
ncbi:hypothetical protein Gogos_015133 [Gossypium gossypioides]|nr:hypothetical protein [Gossypium gossypioides]